LNGGSGMSSTPTPLQPSPRADWTQTASAVASILTVIVATVGLLGLWIQVKTYNDAEKQERDRRVRDAYGKLYPMDMDVWKFIGQNPKLQNAFLNDKEGSIVSKMSEDERGRFDAACQMMGDMFEYYLLIEPDLQGNEWSSHNNCWGAYMELIHQQSTGFREYIRTTEPEWTTTFVERFKKISADKKKS
jgi:hypothetical protein